MRYVVVVPLLFLSTVASISCFFLGVTWGEYVPPEEGYVYVHNETGRQITIDAVGIGEQVARPYRERARDLDVVVNTTRHTGLFERQVVNLDPKYEHAYVAAYVERQWSMPHAGLRPWQQSERRHNRVQITQVHFVTVEELRNEYERTAPSEIPLSWESAYIQLTSFGEDMPRHTKRFGEYLSSTQRTLRTHVAASRSQLNQLLQRITG